MNSKFGIQKLEDVEATLTVTMTVDEWRQLNRQIGIKWPASEFSRMVSGMIGEFNRHWSEYESKK